MEIAKGKKLFFLNHSSITKYFTDIGEIYARLFDHTPFTKAEIQYCYQEFEVKVEKDINYRLTNIYLHFI